MHYHVDWRIVQKHGHGSSASIGVGPNVLGFEAQIVFTYACGVAPEGGKRDVLSELKELPVNHVGSYGFIDGGDGMR